LGNRLRFLIRGIGLLGLFAAAIGVVLASTVFEWPRTWESLRDTTQAVWKAALPTDTHDFAHVSSLILLIGLAAVALAVAFELLTGLFLAASRRTAVGASEIIAVAAAIALLVFVNAYSFHHYDREDLTRDHQFTLPADVSNELRKLRPDEPTTIVVLQKHRTFGAASEMRDTYVSASEAKVTEKVKDLVDEFREFGPRFNVVVLDTEQLGYDAQVAALTEKKPELKAAIDAAPENSILFAAQHKVQRLGFNEFLQLDRTASRQANDGRGNLVLLPQSVEKFARRVLAVQERRPKVALAVINRVLGIEGEYGELTHSGLKTVLTQHGFEVTEIVLKTWNGDQQPAAYTHEESKIEEIEGDLEVAEIKVIVTRQEVAELAQIKEVLEKKLASSALNERSLFYNRLFNAAKNRSWLEVIDVFRRWQDKLSKDTEAEFKKELIPKLESQKAISEQQIEAAEKDRRAVEDRLNAALKDERVVQDRRGTDVKAKLARLLADVDLLIIPRFTIFDVVESSAISSRLHKLDKDQIAVIRDYMKSGRPVLALLGPTAATSNPAMPTKEDEDDSFEKLLADRGVELGGDAVIYDAEMRGLAAQGIASKFGAAAKVEVAPLSFTDAELDKSLEGGAAESKAPNPIGAAMRLSSRSFDRNFELRLRALRPVYIQPDEQKKLPFIAEFAFTGPDSWNESQPLSQRDFAGRSTYVPKFEPTKEGDKKKGTHAEERRGPFPVAVAIDGRLPSKWFDQPKPAIPNERLVVIGSGAVFVGTELKPVQEKLLLDSVNWLLKRPDRLPKESEQAWSYPRVDLPQRDLILWRWSTAALMPLAVVIVGLFAVMFRR
ncbi:MAG TPA: hypothetical protein VGI99_08825, partial [Gemmataceae bacterium]